MRNTLSSAARAERPELGGISHVSSPAQQTVRSDSTIHSSGGTQHSVPVVRGPESDKVAPIAAPLCPSCGRRAKLVSADELRMRPDLDTLYYVCCGLRAIASPQTFKPKGPLSDHTMRRLRKETWHAISVMRQAFNGPKSSRERGIEWLTHKLGLRSFDVSTLTPEQCHKVISLCYRRVGGLSSSLANFQPDGAIHT